MTPTGTLDSAVADRPGAAAHRATPVQRPMPSQQPDSRSDQDLIDAANGGDVAAFEALYLRYRDWCVRMAYRFRRDHDEALDVLQDAWTYVLRKFPGFVLTGKMTTFLYPVVKHTALHARRKATRQVALDVTGTGLEPGAEQAEPIERTRAELSQVLAGLNEPQRETILLRFVDGFSLQEIADATDAPLGTVKSRLHKALRALREDPRTKTFFGE